MSLFYLTQLEDFGKAQNVLKVVYLFLKIFGRTKKIKITEFKINFSLSITLKKNEKKTKL